MSRRALIIGINYLGQNGELAGCINDANNIHKLLLRNGYSHQNITMMTDITPSKPTKANIEAHINAFINAKAGDTLFFYFAGHGVQQNDNNSDERDRKDECLVPLDYITRGVITDDWIMSVVSRIPKDVEVRIFMDCCHSGSIIDLPWRLEGNSLVNENSLRPNANVIAISGCQDHQTSIEVNGQGLATNAFIQHVGSSRDSFTLSRRMLETVHNQNKNQTISLSVSKTSLLQKRFL